MRKELIETGKNVEAAIEAACEKLGCERDACEWDILELPKKSFLGLKTTPAKVKVWIEVPDPKEVPTPKPERVEKQAAPAAVQGSRQQPRQQPRQDPPRREPVSPPKAVAQPVREPAVRAEPIVLDEKQKQKVEITKAYVQSILQAMGLNATLKDTCEEGGVCINIEGEGLGMIIGRRGETLDAIQYLSSLVANRLEGDYLRMTIDCGDYRAKRRDTLEALAKKLASQVLKTNISKTLEPMNPFERRIIHATVSEIEGVSSLSIGEEPNRRVVITSPTARSRGPRRRDGRDSRDGGRDSRGGDRRRSSGGPRRDDRDRERRRPAPAPRPASPAEQQGLPKQLPEDSIEKPLYGKLDLD